MSYSQCARRLKAINISAQGCKTISLISPVIGLHDQLHQHVIMHEVAVLDDNKASLVVKCVSRVASLHNVGPSRSVMLPEAVNFGQVCMFARRRCLKQNQ